VHVTKEDLIRVSAPWGELAFDALTYLEKTAEEIEQAKQNGTPIPESLKAARKSAMTNLDAALYSAPALREALKGSA